MTVIGVFTKPSTVEPEEKQRYYKTDSHQPFPSACQPFFSFQDKKPAHGQQPEADRIKIGEPCPQLLGVIEVEKICLV
jgi:hypothetical protein